MTLKKRNMLHKLGTYIIFSRLLNVIREPLGKTMSRNYAYPAEVT